MKRMKLIVLGLLGACCLGVTWAHTERPALIAINFDSALAASHLPRPDVVDQHSHLLQSLPPIEPDAQATDATPDGARQIDCDEENGILVCGDCRNDYDCPENSACLLDAETGRDRCFESDCIVDDDCVQGQRCIVPNWGWPGDPIVSLCSPIGTQGEGEPCANWPHGRQQACREGLVCSPRMICERTCNPMDHATCEKDGLGCILQTPSGWFCGYDCMSSGCKKGKTCVQLEGPMSVCSKPIGDNCMVNPCPKGYICDRTPGYRRPVMHFECVPACSPLAPKCKIGYECAVTSAGFRYGCFKKCDRQDPYDCPEEKICHQSSLDPSHVWTCGFM